MSNWLSLEKEQQIDLFTQAGAKTGLPPFAIEKDAWVTLILRMLFASELYARRISEASRENQITTHVSSSV